MDLDDDEEDREIAVVEIRTSKTMIRTKFTPPSTPPSDRDPSDLVCPDPSRRFSDWP